MHEQNLRLPTNLRVYRNRKDKAAVFRTLAVVVFELFFPETLDYMRVDEAVGRGLTE
jgi:hypothetical protein